MMKCSFLLATMLMGSVTHAQDFSEEIASATHHEGLIDIYADANKGRLLLALPAAENGLIGRYIHQAYLRRGLGSNPLGLDRTLGDEARIIAVQRHGPKIVFEVENWRYRAVGGSAGEDLAVDESFAKSVMWATDIVAESADGTILIDVSSLISSDFMGIAAHLGNREQGSFSVDASRSYPLLDEALAFPRNIELEAVVTLASSNPGSEVQATTPLPNAVSLIMHHSLVALPEDGFEPRVFDPRTGAIEHIFYDFASDLTDRITTRFARRHRLQKDADGNVIKPIIFYLDRGAPEPMRTALLEGARWWSEAFEAAGFPGGYRVELLPEGVHRLDARYNIITWVHRATRGWSYGASVVDPRTGEIIKGYVLLGSQRVRQDRLIFEGLAGTEKSGSGADDDPVELALDRIRQLSAHEVGHTIGLQHNFAASTYDRGSVMDYPAPWIRPDGNGGLDFSQTYAAGAGPWDIFAIKWLYAEASGEQLDEMVREAHDDGLVFVTDSHGRGIGTAHRLGAIWDNGTDPTAALRESMHVRAIALRDFGANRVVHGQAMSDLMRVIVPIYFYHRYQIAAAAKAIGGVDYAYRVRGDGRDGVTPVPAGAQVDAVSALLGTVTPEALDIPDSILDLLTPYSRGFFADPITDRELVVGSIGPLFDPVAAARQSAALTMDALLHPDRAARLMEQHRRDPSLPGLQAIIDRAWEAVSSAPRGESPRFAALRRTTQRALVDQLLVLAGTAGVAPDVQALAAARLGDIGRDLARTRTRDPVAAAHNEDLSATINRFGQRGLPEGWTGPALPSPPPGSPIGADSASDFWGRCWH